jgi:uncharacterized protein (TIGR02118 family)
MAPVKLIVLYPHPTDVEQFNRDYQEHLKLVHAKTQIPEDVRPYTVTRFVETPQGKPPFYQMYTMPFPSFEAFQQAASAPAMQELGADAARISTGGPPVVLVGVDIT